MPDIHLNSVDKKKDNYEPLLDRVASWWNSDTDYNISNKKAKEQNKPSEIHVNRKNFSLERWTDQRVQILEILWGTGTRIPGDAAFNKILFKTGSLTSKSKILDLAVGLGNCARMMAKDSFAHIDVIETYPDLLPYFNKLTREHKLDRFLFTLKGNLVDVKLTKAKYDLIYGREVFFKIKNKQHVIEKCIDSLSTRGSFIFTDFILEKDASSYGIFKNWSQRENGIIYPISEGVYRKIFSGLDMKFIQPIDYSKQYIHYVNMGWVRLKQYLEVNKFDDAFVDIMIEESELWLSRVRALESGKLKLLRFHIVY